MEWLESKMTIKFINFLVSLAESLHGRASARARVAAGPEA